MSTAPVMRRPETLEERFHRLASVWDEETTFLSDSIAIAEHPAYQEIIAMGPPVIPLLLRDLEKTHRHWFHALHKLTGDNPIPEADRGRIIKMAEAWVRWGREHGYQW